MIDINLAFIIFIIGIALVFDFTNGMHDAANSISTIVSTRVLPPKLAVFWAALFNFIAFAIFGTAVAKTIGSGMIDIKTVTPQVIFCGLLGAIGWNIFTWLKCPFFEIINRSIEVIQIQSVAFNSKITTII